MLVMMIQMGRLMQHQIKSSGFITRKLLKDVNPSLSWRCFKSSVSTIWIEIEKLIKETESIDLAHGCSDFNIANGLTDHLLAVSREPTLAKNHQYTRSLGHPRLVEILARMNSLSLGRHVDPYSNIIITIGATHAVFCSFSSLIRPGDKVLLFSPIYDSYEPHVKRLNALPVIVNLKTPTKKNSESLSSDFTFDRDELELKIRGSKCLVLNNPSNPLGKAFTKDELEFIAELCLKHDMIVISDEVYERMVHSPHKHIPIASVPGMWERTVTLGSAGKSFSVTGWKTGWCIGPEHLIKRITTSLEDSVYTCPTPIQEAVAMGFEKEYEMRNDGRSYFNRVSSIIQPRVARVAEMVKSVGMKPILPQAGFFLFVDISDMEFEKSIDDVNTKDVQLAKMMILEQKIGVLPSNFFFPESDRKRCEDFLRFSCIKADDTLEKAEIQFQKWKTKMNSEKQIKKTIIT